MALNDDLQRIAQGGGHQAAAAELERRARADDPAALHMLGQWRLWGAFGPQDVPEGRRLIGRAAECGDLDAALAEVSLIATGTGGPREPDDALRRLEALAAQSPLARQQCDLLSRAPTTMPARVVMQEDPLVARIDGLLSAEQCAWIIARAAPKLQPSIVVDPRTGQPTPNPIRTSHGANFAPVEEDLVLHAINRRIADASGTTWEQGEPLHVLRYTPGQQYRRHLDALPGVANQRVLTVLVYLNDEFTGGETEFRSGLKVRGRAGDAVLFANVDAAGRADPRTEHAGLPVRSGSKWLATRWIRARRVHPWEPATMA